MRIHFIHWPGSSAGRLMCGAKGAPCLLAGACSGMALEDRRCTHAKHFSVLKHKSKPKEFLKLGLAVAPMWPPFGRTCSWLGSWGWFLFHRAGCERFHFEKSLVLVASHAKCRSKLVMILHVIAVGWPILWISNGPQNGRLLWRNPQHSNTCYAENQRPQNGCWMPFMAHMAWS